MSVRALQGHMSQNVLSQIKSLQIHIPTTQSSMDKPISPPSALTPKFPPSTLSPKNQPPTQIPKKPEYIRQNKRPMKISEKSKVSLPVVRKDKIKDSPKEEKSGIVSTNSHGSILSKNIG